jgi:hypothetical protein
VGRVGGWAGLAAPCLPALHCLHCAASHQCTSLTSLCPHPTHPPPGLTELDLGSNALTRLPPALHTATALRRLLAGHNSELEATQAEAEAFLLALHHLERVDLAGTAIASEVAQQLADSLAARRLHEAGNVP